MRFIMLAIWIIALLLPISTTLAAEATARTILLFTFLLFGLRQIGRIRQLPSIPSIVLIALHNRQKPFPPTIQPHDRLKYQHPMSLRIPRALLIIIEHTVVNIGYVMTHKIHLRAKERTNPDDHSQRQASPENEAHRFAEG